MTRNRVRRSRTDFPYYLTYGRLRSVCLWPEVVLWGLLTDAFPGSKCLLSAGLRSG
jgi:hypothetical protein